MRYCTKCARYHPGAPPYCPGCGLTFSVRRCRRGHVNDRGAAYCTECGSADLSTPAPQEGASSRASRLAAQAAVGAYAAAIAVTAAALAALLIPWDAVAREIALVAAGWAALRYLALRAPGPAKKAGRAALSALRKKEGTNRRRE
jgi:hypothetical protein